MEKNVKDWGYTEGAKLICVNRQDMDNYYGFTVGKIYEVIKHKGRLVLKNDDSNHVASHYDNRITFVLECKILRALYCKEEK